jgi:hypothetical protein
VKIGKVFKKRDGNSRKNARKCRENRDLVDEKES